VQLIFDANSRIVFSMFFSQPQLQDNNNTIITITIIIIIIKFIYSTGLINCKLILRKKLDYRKIAEKRHDAANKNKQN